MAGFVFIYSVQCIFSRLDWFEFAKWGFHLNIYTKCNLVGKLFPCLHNFLYMGKSL